MSSHIHSINPAYLSGDEQTLFQALETRMGREQAEAAFYTIIECFGGASVYFKKMESLTRETRNAAILEMHKDGGATIRQLAKRFNLADNTIREIIFGRSRNTNSMPTE